MVTISQLVLYLVLLALAVVVVGIALAILRYLHWSVLVWVVVPIWITVLAAMFVVHRVTLNITQGRKQYTRTC
jgi:type IV secretory pathway VirB2 component (pilin)